MSPTDVNGASAPQAPLGEPDNTARNRLVIGLLLVSAFVVILNETIMSVAIPHLMVDLEISASAAEHPPGLYPGHVRVQRRYPAFGNGAGI